MIKFESPKDRESEESDFMNGYSFDTVIYDSNNLKLIEFR